MSLRCVHCRTRKPCHGGRGLCRVCWNSSAIRNRYRPVRDTRPEEMTAEQVERLVAEQSKVLPAWWGVDARRQEAVR